MYDSVFVTIVLIANLVFALLQIILFFKVWGMTNRVKDILKIINKDSGLNLDTDYSEVLCYCAKQISLAKRMIAIGDENATKILKGLIYDIDNIKEVWQDKLIETRGLDRYLNTAKELLNSK